MSRYQGVEYQSGQVIVLVEQPDSPMVDVWFMDRHSDRRTKLSLAEIVQEVDPEIWLRRSQGYAWPHPIEQDDEQLGFLSECTRRFCGPWLRGDSAQS